MLVGHTHTTTAHPWEVSYGALIPISILIGLQGFAQTACYSVHHKGLLRDVSLIYYLAYQAWDFCSLVGYSNDLYLCIQGIKIWYSHKVATLALTVTFQILLLLIY